MMALQKFADGSSESPRFRHVPLDPMALQGKRCAFVSQGLSLRCAGDRRKETSRLNHIVCLIASLVGLVDRLHDMSSSKRAVNPPVSFRLASKGFCIIPWEYTHWVLTPFRHMISVFF